MREKAFGHRAKTRLFALIGAKLKRPLLFGLFFVVGWELLVLVLPGSFKRLSVAYYLRGLIPHSMPNDSVLGLLQAIVREIPTLTESLFWMAAITVFCLWWAGRTVANKEYVLEQ